MSTEHEKRDVAELILTKGTLLIHLDPRHADVLAPFWLKNQPQLVLQVGLNLPVPIPDLRVDHQGIYGTLSFNRSPYTCFCPWVTIFALVDDSGQTWVWPESMPTEVHYDVESRQAKKAPRARKKPLPPWLRVVK